MSGIDELNVELNNMSGTIYKTFFRHLISDILRGIRSPNPVSSVLNTNNNDNKNYNHTHTNRFYFLEVGFWRK